MFMPRVLRGSMLKTAATGLGVLSAGVAASPSSSAASDAPRCKPVVLCGPSGAGKSTLIQRLQKEFPEDYGFSVSHTTRDPRPGEQHGVHYNFAKRADMEAEIAEGKFLEHANVHGNLYGTSFAAIDSVGDCGRVCILDIDIQGVKSCKRLGFDAGAYVFIAPPSLEVLEARLRGRGTETEDKVRRRLDAAVHEMTEKDSIEWDALIVNDDLDSAYDKLRNATEAGREACRALRTSAAIA